MGFLSHTVNQFMVPVQREYRPGLSYLRFPTYEIEIVTSVFRRNCSNIGKEPREGLAGVSDRQHHGFPPGNLSKPTRPFWKTPADKIESTAKFLSAGKLRKMDR